MPTNTYVALDKVTVGTATPSITFTGISQAYTDLVIVINGSATGYASDLNARFNSDSNSNYSRTVVEGDGTSAQSSRLSNQTYLPITGTVCDFSSARPNVTKINIQNYCNTTTYKTVISTSGRANAGTGAVVGLWRSTSAITSITFYSANYGFDFAAGTTFSLYGIANADSFAKATGGMISDDATYWYHTFAGSGTFTPKQNLSVDYLVVAGGGGGGSAFGGGGGAGGLLTSTGFSVTSGTNYSCVIGAGGANGRNAGSNTTFGAITATGGGGGGESFGSGLPGQSGGSGGGGATFGGSAIGTGTAGQGNNGGTGFYDGGGGLQGGGGGGASAAGGAAGANGGNGGAGTASSMSGTSVTYAGGGGGGAGVGTGGNGGAGGGGAGSLGNGTNGTISTGGGGGGAQGTGGAGGSGIVIVRYLKA